MQVLQDSWEHEFAPHLGGQDSFDVLHNESSWLEIPQNLEVVRIQEMSMVILGLVSELANVA